MSGRYYLRSRRSAPEKIESKSHKRNTSSSSMLPKRAKLNEDFQIRLPSEILSHIFQFLTLSDRKSVRRTCKLWNSSSKRGFFAHKEKFVFRESHDDMVHVLSTSNYPILNLEFQGLKMNHLPKNIWLECGPKIQSLRFYRCNLNPKTLKEIILHCIHLTNFEIYESRYLSNHNNSSVFNTTLKYFIKKSIIRPKLRIFSITISNEIMSCDWWEDLFVVFPNMKHFDASLLASRIKPFSLASSFQLKTLSLSSNSENFFSLDRSKFPLLWTSKLTKFISTMGSVWTRSSVASLFEFFSEQRNLEMIHLRIPTSLSFKPLLFHILKSCTKLHDLRILHFVKNLPKTIFTHDEAKTFFLAIANLQRLDINHNIEIETLPVLPSLNLALRSLNFKNDADHINFSIFILNHCTKLEYLELNEPTDDILQLTFKTQSELRLLRVRDGSTRTFFSPAGLAGSGKEFSIQRLQKLEFLEIRSTEVLLTDCVISEFRFPQLRTLKLMLRLDVSHTNMCEMLSRLPRLQILYLRYGEVIGNIDNLIGLCKRAKELTSLLISSTSTIISDETPLLSCFKRLFDENSNLNYFITRKEILLRQPSTELARFHPIINYWIQYCFV